MLKQWGIDSKHVMEMNFNSLIPSEATLQQVVTQMRTDSAAASTPAAGDSAPCIYLVDSSIVVALLMEGARAEECGGLLAKLQGLVFGHIDEQVCVCM